MKKYNITIKNDQCCPEIEELSGFYDNALELQPEVITHINNCPLCMEKLAQFKMLDRVIKQQLSTSIPENLIDKIKTQVHQELAIPHKPSQPIYGLLFKIAAAFAIISFAAFYSTNLFNSTSVNHPNHSLQKIHPVQTIESSQQNNNEITPYYNNKQPNFLPGTMTGSTIPLDNIIGANYGGSREPVFHINHQNDKKNTLISIAPTVHQVWLSQNPVQAVNRLKEIMKSLNITPAKITGLNGEFSGTITLTKMQLVKLVRACKQSGLDLLSPHAPQPEQDKFSGKPATQVKYKFNILAPGN